MKGSPNIARVGALIGDPARAAMLNALMCGKALTASELAREAGITRQTASTHLAKLEQGSLLHLHKQGRHKYFSLASEEVARVLEGLMGLVADNDLLRCQIGPKDEALRKARFCYNHLAGDMGIRLYDSLLAKGYLILADDSLALSNGGYTFVVDFGIDIDRLLTGKTKLCRQCMDWSERRSHLAGSLGRAFLDRFEELRWLRRVPDSRVAKFSEKGALSFNDTFAP
ncbi:MAG: helix-turn-helix transcriptional regulator [Granulosicoccus sp.]